MTNNMIYVRSASDFTLVIHVPELPLSKTWTKRGQRLPIDREQLVIAYYHPAVEFLFKQGLLITDDKEFLQTVGLMSEDEKLEVYELNENLLKRMIKLMPLEDLKKQVKTLSKTQIQELAEYAISHYQDLSMDRIDYLSTISNKNILKAIEAFKADKE